MKPPIHLLIAELEAATRPMTDGRRVLGWPQVSHPLVVRAWLGGDAVIDVEDVCYYDETPDGREVHFWAWRDVGTLSDPEAAGWALAAARAVAAGWRVADVLAALATDAPDPVCQAYVEAIELGV